ncbi:hypothetical protein [Oscillatoria sp. FACHB-1406]|uniref:hypothetical protein n=1 Tax=Oscillatoria sp. FACHB-1406 TaxID=2692846 RepID=UPI001682BA4B|nr:hypothetical protein [Oscillatoria sp. FACHB-1406]MBD2579926.1 hypothetical protein [Oscillatoria sp. FACHB-1406]
MNKLGLAIATTTALVFWFLFFSRPPEITTVKSSLGDSSVSFPAALASNAYRGTIANTSVP